MYQGFESLSFRKTKKKFEKVKIPLHIAIIMDGNIRWAKNNRVCAYIAYKIGIKIGKKILELVKILNIKYITLYVFSMENWNRELKIVNVILNMFQNYIYREISKKTRIIFIGNHNKLNKDLKIMMNYIKKQRFENVSLVVIIAISYSGRSEILEAIIKLSLRSKNIKEEKYKSLFQEIINPNKIPDPDLLIRTSGEQRISNFLLWQISYTELYFLKTLWPDFRKKDLIKAIKEFNNRNRKYGK